MVRISRLYAQLLNDSRATPPFREFERLLEAFGFSLDRTKGSHRQYVHPAVPFVLTVQPARMPSAIRCASFLIWSPSSG